MSISCLSHPPTRGLACNPGTCPDWESNRRPFGSQARTQSAEPRQPGWETSFQQESCGQKRGGERESNFQSEKAVTRCSWRAHGRPPVGTVSQHRIIHHLNIFTRGTHFLLHLRPGKPFVSPPGILLVFLVYEDF